MQLQTALLILSKVFTVLLIIVLVLLSILVLLILFVFLAFLILVFSRLGVFYSDLNGKELKIRIGLISIPILPEKKKKSNNTNDSINEAKIKKKEKRSERLKKIYDKLDEKLEKRRMKKAIRRQKKKAKFKSSYSKANLPKLKKPNSAKSSLLAFIKLKSSIIKLFKVRNLQVNYIISGTDSFDTAYRFGKTSAIIGNIIPVYQKILDVKIDKIHLNYDFINHNRSTFRSSFDLWFRPIAILFMLIRFLRVKSKYQDQISSDYSVVKKTYQ